MYQFGKKTIHGGDWFIFHWSLGALLRLSPTSTSPNQSIEERSATMCSHPILMHVSTCIEEGGCCFYFLPKRGRYWKIHPWRPRVKLKGNFEGHGKSWDLDMTSRPKCVQLELIEIIYSWTLLLRLFVVQNDFGSLGSPPKEKFGIIWEFFPSVGPPPFFGRPPSQKN